MYDTRGLLYQLTGVDLVAIPGLNATTVQAILSKIGLDLRLSRSAPVRPAPDEPILALFGVLEGRHGLQCVLGGVRQHDPPLTVLETVDGDSHLAFAEAKEPSHANDGI